MPPRRVVTPENLSLDFLVDLDREDGPVGLNLDPAHFQRDPETGAIGMALLPPAGLDDLPDVDATLPTDGYFLAYDGAAEKWVPVAPPSDDLPASEIKTLYEANADTNAFTDAEKTKLAGLVGSHFVGTFASLFALTSTHTTNAAGSYAYVDAGEGVEVQLYIWDESDEEWVAGSPSEETAGSIKTKYESNANTNAFTDAEKTKLAGIETGATADLTASEIKTLYEGNADTNAFTDAEKTKLAGLGSGGGGGAAMVIPASGEYIFTSNGASGSGMSGANTATNLIRLYAYVPSKDVTVDGVAVVVASASAGNTVKAVIYASDANGRPTTLLAESGNMATDTTGTKTASIASLSLVAGNVYWIGIRATASISIQALANSGVPDINGGSPVTSLCKTLARTVTYATGAPNPWVWNPAEIGAGAAHHIWLKVA
jgi:hypothetical protein